MALESDFPAAGKGVSGGQTKTTFYTHILNYFPVSSSKHFKK